MGRAQLALHDGGLDGAIRYYSENHTPPILVIEADYAPQELFQRLEALAEHCDMGTDVIVIGSQNDVRLYRDLLSRGVKDYLPKPVEAPALVETLAALLEDSGKELSGRAIAFMGACGGVGSSTLAQNTAWLLADMFEEDVVLLDLDLAFGSVSLNLNLEAQEDIAAALQQHDRLDTQLLSRFVARYNDHLMLLTAPATPTDSEQFEPGALEALAGLVRQTAPFVVFDLPHQWSAWTKTALDSAEEVVLVVPPTLLGLRDCKRLLDLVKASRVADPPVRIVVNRVGGYAKTEVTAKEFETVVGAAPDLQVPHDQSFFGNAANNAKMLGEIKKDHKVVQSLRDFALTVSGRPTQPQAGKGRKRGWLRAGRGRS